MVSLVHFQLLSAALFAIGLYGVLARRSAVLIVMSIELMLNAVNINLIAAASHLGYKDAGEVFANFDGQIIAIFVITVAAAEVGLALAIILRMYRNRSTVNVDEIDPDELVANIAMLTTRYSNQLSAISSLLIAES